MKYFFIFYLTLLSMFFFILPDLLIAGDVISYDITTQDKCIEEQRNAIYDNDWTGIRDYLYKSIMKN